MQVSFFLWMTFFKIHSEEWIGIRGFKLNGTLNNPDVTNEYAIYIFLTSQSYCKYSYENHEAFHYKLNPINNCSQNEITLLNNFNASFVEFSRLLLNCKTNILKKNCLMLYK